MATKSSKKPLMALGKIPSVDLLKEHLGLNTAPVNVKNAFRDITVQWRKTNIGSNSQPATDLTDWHSPTVQNDLYTLAETFLADKDNAQQFWSPTRPWKYESTLQYPDDKERIIELLVQLFFKQNKAFQANSKYAAWANKDPESKSSREGSTSQGKASMDTASDKSTDKSTRKRPRSETFDSRLSPTPTFIDLSGTLDSSPPLPWDRTLSTPRDIYDMPDEQEPVAGRPSGSYGSTLPTIQGGTGYIGDSGPSKRRKPYDLRDKPSKRIGGSISDTEFEELIREPSSDSDEPQSSQNAPIAPMMDNSMDLESHEHQLPTHTESSTVAGTQAESAPKAKPGSATSQMPPPPSTSKKTPSPKQKNPKSHNIILKTSKGGVMRTGGSSASKHAKPVPNTNYKPPSVEDVTQSTTLAMSPTMRAGFEAVPLPEDGNHAGSVSRATAAAKKTKSTSSHPQPAPNHGPRKAQKSSNKAKNITSGKASQTSTTQHTGTGNSLSFTNPATNLTATGPSSQKTQAKPSSTDTSSKQHPKPQMQINFFIITTREPCEKWIFWPEGKFQGTSLSDFIAGVAKATKRDGIERLELTLKTSTLEAMVPVAKDDEASWLVAKKHFGESLKAARAKAKAKGLDNDANPSIYVEPFYGVVNAVDEVDEEIEEEEDVSFLFE